MYAKQSYPLLVRDEFDTEHIRLTEVTSSMKGQARKSVLEKTPRTECCAVRVTEAVKCTQGDRRPLGELPPLSDTAPINIQIGEGRASMPMAKTTSTYPAKLASPVSKSTAWDQSNGWNLGDPMKSAARRAVVSWQGRTTKPYAMFHRKSELSIVSESQGNA